MIRKVLSYKNKELGFYENIKLVDNLSNQDIKGSCERYLKMCPIKDVPPIAGRQIEIIGEFDDENGLVAYGEKIVIIDCDEILKKRFPQIYESNDTEESK